MLLIAPLPWRRRAPVEVFALVMLACGAELLLVDEFIGANVAALVALYTLMAYGPRRLAAIGCAVALVGTVPFAAIFDNPSSTDALLTWLVLIPQVALAAALGDRTRARSRSARRSSSARGCWPPSATSRRRSPPPPSGRGSRASSMTSSRTRCP